MIRLLILVTCSAALVVGCQVTRSQERTIKDVAGTVTAAAGLGRPLGEGVAALGLYLFAHQHGRRRERQVAQRAMKDPLQPLDPGTGKA